MGVVKRQSLNYSILSYLGILIGGISTIFIYPTDLELYGYAQFLISSGTLFHFFASFGIPTIIIRYFSHFSESEDQQKAFFTRGLIAQSLSFVLVMCLFSLTQDWFYEKLALLDFDVEKIRANIVPILILSFILTYNRLLINYISNFRKTAATNGINSLVPKVLVPVFFIVVIQAWISRTWFPFLIISIYSLILVLLFSYGKYKKIVGLNWRKLQVSPELRKDIFIYAIFGVLGNIGGVLAFRIDSVMIATILGDKETGIYNFFFFLANTMQVIASAVIAIVGPMIAEHWKKQEMDEIHKLYKRTSTNLFAGGVGMYLLIGLNLSYLVFATSRAEELLPFVSVFFLLGATWLIELLTSVNTQIIAFSKKHYYFNLIAMSVLAVLNVLNNYFFIGRFGIWGAALSTLISLSLYNILKLIFIYWKFRMHPFSGATLKLLTLGLVIFFGVFYLVNIDTGFWFLNIIIYSSIVVAAYGGGLLYFRISPDINDLVLDYYKKIMSRLRS